MLNEERAERNRLTLSALVNQQAELSLLIEAAVTLNNRGQHLPLSSMDAVLGRMWEAYSDLEN